MSVNVFLPCREGSQRVPKKNIKAFGGFHRGLLEIKLNQLLECKLIDNIFLSSDDEEVLNFAKDLKNSKIILHKRVKELSSSQTSTDCLIKHAYELVQEGDILWTHVTSPFTKADDYEMAICKYYEALKNDFDSLMSVNALYEFLWDKKGSINYDRNKEKWPRTQTLTPLYKINSAIFLASSEIYKIQKDRIGKNPFLYIMDKIKGFDIDDKEDFLMADILYKWGGDSLLIIFYLFKEV